MAKYECSVCRFIYDEEKEGKKWEQLPDDWVCPVCGAAKSYFKIKEETKTESPAPPAKGKKICSVCGYIIGAGHRGEVCPACGAPKTAFQTYEDKVSQKRRKILDLHLHNIMVHFPQAFSLLMLFLLVMVFFLEGSLKAEFMITSRILSLFLPLSVLASIISGLLDGKNRFLRVTTPILKRKIVVGSLFLVFSLGVFFILNFPDFRLLWHLVSAGLTGLSVLCSLILGYSGGGLSRAITPG